MISFSFLSAEVVRASPYILHPADESVFWAHIGQNMTIECAAFVVGNIHFQLLKMNENRSKDRLEVLKKPTTFISEGKRRNVAQRYRAIFHFNKITKKDFDEFTCMAGNSAGFSATSFRIKEKIKSSTIDPGEYSINVCTKSHTFRANKLWTNKCFVRFLHGTLDFFTAIVDMNHCKNGPRFR